MNTPGFTAETSLSKTSRRYQNGKPTFNPLTQGGRAFYPAAETIEVFGCPPGTVPWLEGETAVCILTEPSNGGEQSPGGDDTIGDAETPRGGGKRPRNPKKRPESKPKPGKRDYTLCTSEQLKSEKFRQCVKKSEEDILSGKKAIHYPICVDELSEVLCCTESIKGFYVCDVEKI